MRRVSLSLLVVALGALVGCGGSSSTSSGRSLTLLPPADVGAAASAVSPNGVLTIGARNDGTTATAYVWSGSTGPTVVTPTQSGAVLRLAAVTTLGALFAEETADGGITNLPETSTSVGGAFTPLPLPAGVTSARIAGVSEDGSVVLGSSSNGLFVVSGGAATTVPNSGGSSSGALLSGDGKIVFQVTASGVVKTVLATMAQTTPIPATGNPTIAGVGQTGNVLVGAVIVAGTPNSHTYRLTGTTFVDLGTLGSDVSSYPTGADRTGNIVVGVSTSASGATRPFVLRGAGPMFELKTDSGFGGLTHVVPTGISADGTTVVGYGLADEGTVTARTRAWKMKL